jgi:hypothetical protein
LIAVNDSLILAPLVNLEPENQSEPLPLDELNIAPSWAKAPAKSFDHHPGEESDRRRERDFARGNRERGPRRPKRPREDGSPGQHPKDRRRERVAGPGRLPVKPPPPPPLPVEIVFLPERSALTAMIETVRQSSRACSLFDLAKLILNRAERHAIRLTRKDGPLYRTLLLENVFLTKEAALGFTVRRCAEKLFSETKKPVEPPKGSFQFVNRCGLTGEWLGPPNFHEYPARLIKHHQTRLAHVPFEKFKASIETVRDEGAVQAWLESRSSITEYTCRLCAESPVMTTDRMDIEKHVHEQHAGALVAEVSTAQIDGPTARQLEGRLLELVRRAWEDERRFPLKTANELRPRLLKAGLHLFKRGKGITYVTPIKLNRFESIAHLAENVQKIITVLRANPDFTRKQLAECLAPIDETILAADLHWLIQDGYVVEFFDGRLWALDASPAATARPQKPVTEAPPTPPVSPQPEPSASAP